MEDGGEHFVVQVSPISLALIPVQHNNKQDYTEGLTEVKNQGDREGGGGWEGGDDHFDENQTFGHRSLEYRTSFKGPLSFVHSLTFPSVFPLTLI